MKRICQRVELHFLKENVCFACDWRGRVLSVAVAAVFEVVAAFFICELVEDAATETPEGINGAFGSVSQQLLEFRKR